MKTTTFKFFTVCSIIMCWAVGVSSAGEKATVENVYEKVLEGVSVLEVLGPEGLPAFGPKGDFIWKDTYVAVTNCKEKVTVAHPVRPKENGTDITVPKCKKTGKMFVMDMCKAAESPKGGWTEYWYYKPGEPKDKIFRKVSFAITVPGTEYMLTSGIYNDNISLDELNASVK